MPKGKPTTMRLSDATIRRSDDLIEHYELNGNRTALIEYLVAKDHRIVSELEEGDHLFIRKANGREIQILII